MRIMKLISDKAADLRNSKSVTIAFLGDSVTQGCFEVYKTGETSIETVFDVNCAYHTYLKRLLSTMYPKAPVNMLNAGISGDNAGGGLARLERDVLRYNPDMVVVSYGLNDSAKGLDSIGEYTKSLDSIFNILNEKNIEVIFMTTNGPNTNISCHITDDFIKSIAETTMQIKNSGIFDEYINAAKEVCRQNNVIVCDCYEAWKTMEKNGVDVTNLLSNYINHPTREMNWLFAWSLLKTMMEK